jgi:general secretion pathway protein B
LTGIAWQDDRKNRRAVVNDLLVGEGTVIAGVKVLEIKPTLVRFEKMGIVYETTLPR